ncbi:MAG: PASTA domain-containing protein [bacterium]
MEIEQNEFEQQDNEAEQEPASEPVGNRWRRWLDAFRDWFEWRYLGWLGIGFAAIALFALLMDQMVMPLYTKQGREVILPNVESELLEDAERILAENGFRVILDHEKYSVSVAKGYVISQNPLPLTVVKTGRRIYLTLSRGEKWVEVPRLVGQSERNAQAILRQVELVPGETEFEFSELYPGGVVFDQSVPYGDSVSVGETIRFVVSLGDIPEDLTVPNVVGKSLEEARRILVRTGMQIGFIAFQDNDDLLPETVIQQSIPPDSLVDVGEFIDLIVSQISENPEE